jgi:hypothetical protein
MRTLLASSGGNDAGVLCSAHVIRRSPFRHLLLLYFAAQSTLTSRSVRASGFGGEEPVAYPPGMAGIRFR